MVQRDRTATLSVLIVGAGIGGLAAAIACRSAGHHVTVLEQAPRLGEVGAGITLAPNSTRSLFALGLADRLSGSASTATRVLRRRWQDAAVLGSYTLAEEVERRFGFPYWHVHRADLHTALLATALDPDRAGDPVTVLLGRTVASVEAGPVASTATEDTGVIHHADLLLGADGIHSKVRACLFGPQSLHYSGDVAHRTIVPMAAIAARPELHELFTPSELNCWIGPGRHLVHYQMRGGELLNILAVAPGAETVGESWSALGSREELLATFEGWDDRLLELLSLATDVGCWALYDRDPLPTWVQGSAALLGDACHAMLPYQAQGAAQAIEDAVVLGRLLTGVSPGSLPAALAEYERCRHPRATEIQLGSRANGVAFHLEDGPEQEARDAALAIGGGEFDTLERLWTATA